MSRRKDDMERLEIILVQILFALRPRLRMGGFLLLVIGAGIWFASMENGLIALLLAAYLLVLTISDLALIWTARFGAWLGTFRVRK